jgi:hypothetical protein
VWGLPVSLASVEGASEALVEVSDTLLGFSRALAFCRRCSRSAISSFSDCCKSTVVVIVERCGERLAIAIAGGLARLMRLPYR